MRERNYGRVMFTASASGVYGNFGQANYGAAKSGMIGLMNVLHLEGAKNNIRVNTLLPTAATGMTEGLIPPEMAALMSPETVTPAVLYLLGEDGPTPHQPWVGTGVVAAAMVAQVAGNFVRDRIRPKTAEKTDEPKDSRGD